MKRLIRPIGALVLFLLACSSTPVAGEIQFVTRVFWHERNIYSFHVRAPDSDRIHVVTIPAAYPATILADAPEGQPMWATYEGERISECGSEHVRYDRLTIHIHAEKDVEGGAWDHGKFGSGKTQVIE